MSAWSVLHIEFIPYSVHIEYMQIHAYLCIWVYIYMYIYIYVYVYTYEYILKSMRSRPEIQGNVEKWNNSIILWTYSQEIKADV